MIGVGHFFSSARTIGSGVVATLLPLVLFGWVHLSVGFGRRLFGVGFVVVAGSSLLGGLVVGYRLTQGPVRSAVYGLGTGFVSGVLLGVAGGFLFLAGTRVHPPPEWTILEMLSTTILPAMVTGSIFGTFAFAGGYLGYLTRQRAADADS